MKLYEENLFVTFIEKYNVKIRIIMLMIFIVTESYLFITPTIKTLISLVTSLLLYNIWYYVFSSQSILIGNKSIIIGRILIPHDSIKAIVFEEKKILVEVDEKTFKYTTGFLENKEVNLKRF